MRKKSSYWSEVPIEVGAIIGRWKIVDLWDQSRKATAVCLSCGTKKEHPVWELRAGRTLMCRACARTFIAEARAALDLELITNSRARLSADSSPKGHGGRPKVGALERRGGKESGVFTLRITTSEGRRARIPLGTSNELEARIAREWLVRSEFVDVPEYGLRGTWERGDHWYWRPSFLMSRIRQRICGARCDCEGLDIRERIRRAIDQQEDVIRRYKISRDVLVGPAATRKVVRTIANRSLERGAVLGGVKLTEDELAELLGMSRARLNRDARAIARAGKEDEVGGVDKPQLGEGGAPPQAAE